MPIKPRKAYIHSGIHYVKMGHFPSISDVLYDANCSRYLHNLNLINKFKDSKNMTIKLKVKLARKECKNLWHIIQQHNLQ